MANIAPSANRFLDDVNEYELRNETYATPMQKLAIQYLRRTGAGFTDLAGWLFKSNLVYGSEEGNKLSEEFQKTYNYYLYKSTINLGAEKGSCLAFDKDLIIKSKFIQNMVAAFPDLKGFSTMRNITLSSIAPSGSLSLMARKSIMSYGVEPGFGLAYWKRTRISGSDYEYYFIVPYEVRKRYEDAGLKLPMNSDVLKDDWQGTKGKKVLAFMDEYPANFKFKSATEIKPEDKMALMGNLMKWVDSSISTTYLLNKDTELDDVKKFILQGYKSGVKSIAAFPDKKMYGIVSSIPFKELANNLMTSGVTISGQNFSEKEKKELLLTDGKIVFTSAPKRPKSLRADIYQVRVKDNNYLMAVGLLNGVPYEAFGGVIKDSPYTFKYKTGKIEKIKRNQYKLHIDDLDSINDFGSDFSNNEQNIFRFISMSLRHGTPIKFIVDQLSKSTEDMFSLAAATSRVLKKYIKDGEIATGKACPSCGGTDLVYSDGCVSCSCGWSKCD